MSRRDEVSGLYPPLTPNDAGFLRVSALHTIYWEESGNPEGAPVVFLHGGPGGATEPTHRRYFDPAFFRIILTDQRGCGRSTPHAEVRENTTWDLVADLEALRRHLGIARWTIFGGSWGSTLALAYASRHSEVIRAFVLRGIFTFTAPEIAWFYGGGTATLFPDAWEAFLAPLAPEERTDPVAAYARLLHDPDPEVQLAAARAWSRWECTVSTLRPDPDLLACCDDPRFSLAFARLECHYFAHRGFLQDPEELLRAVPAFAHLPCTIVHGRLDVICPPRNAFTLHRAWPGSVLRWVDEAGHSAAEPAVARALADATDELRPLLRVVPA